MNITLIGSMNDTYSRLTCQWFLDNGIEVEYVEVTEVSEDLPIVLLNGKPYAQGYDLRKLELLTYR